MLGLSFRAPELQAVSCQAHHVWANHFGQPWEKNPKKSQEIPRNPEESKEIPRNPKKVPRNPNKSQGIPRNSQQIPIPPSLPLTGHVQTGPPPGVRPQADRRVQVGAFEAQAHLRGARRAGALRSVSVSRVLATRSAVLLGVLKNIRR